VKSGIGTLTRVLAPCLLAGVSVVSVFGFEGTLIEAVQNDDQAAVAALLTKRVDVNAREDDGATALAWAAVRCNVEIAALLLKAGANPNVTNEQGIGPLYLAITNGSPAIVQLLLGKGADPNIAREDGETPLMAAARLGQIDVMKMLLDRGAEVNAREKKFGQTALMWAAGHSCGGAPAGGARRRCAGNLEGVGHHGNHLHADYQHHRQNGYPVEQ
jgi:ankyrin repeat protein